MTKRGAKRAEREEQRNTRQIVRQEHGRAMAAEALRRRPLVWRSVRGHPDVEVNQYGNVRACPHTGARVD